ncbi:hypothetical protein [Mycobacterium sp.]|nr:hypothetical protein [Mycobacterium sp.]HME49028.1 hypothetical protein [Mycobacterium sp.]
MRVTARNDDAAAREVNDHLITDAIQLMSRHELYNAIGEHDVADIEEAD